MALFQLGKAAASLAACVLIASPAAAMPTPMTPKTQRDSATNKHILLWPYVNTAQIESGQSANLKSTAAALQADQFLAVSNWETWRPSEINPDVSFAPTVATKDHLNGESWDRVVNLVASNADNVVVQYFNEPDFNGIDAVWAADQWKQKMLPLRQQGAKLVGPSVTSDPNVGTPWLRTFMGQLAESEYPDYTGIHFYTTDGQDNQGQIAWAQNYIQSIHTEFGRQIWLNEMASTSRNPADVDAFNKEMTQWLDNQDYVVAYGFLGATTQPVDGFVSPAAQLLEPNGDWSSLGRQWASSA